MKIQRLLIVLSAVFPLAACSMDGLDRLTQGHHETSAPQKTSPIPQEQTITATGRVTYVDVEGGFYGIIAETSPNDKGGPEHLQPMNLDKAYQRDGLRISFEAKPRPDLMSIFMWGSIIEVTKI